MSELSPTTEQEANKAAARQIYAAYSAHDTTALHRVVAADFVDHEDLSEYGGDTARDCLCRMIAAIHATVADARFAVDDLIAEGDRVAARLRFSGRHTGQFLGLDPSGRRFEVALFDVLRFRDGAAVEHWGLTDVYGLLDQLGALGDDDD